MVSICQALYIIGASLSEPHIDKLNVRNIYICILYIVRPSPARHYIQFTASRDIYSGGRMKKLLHSPVPLMCIIIAESAKKIHSVCLSVGTCLKKAKYSDRILGHAPALSGMPSY